MRQERTLLCRRCEKPQFPLISAADKFGCLRTPDSLDLCANQVTSGDCCITKFGSSGGNCQRQKLVKAHARVAAPAAIVTAAQGSANYLDSPPVSPHKINNPQINKTFLLLFQGEDNIEYFLGLTPSGIIVLRNRGKVGNYFW